MTRRKKTLIVVAVLAALAVGGGVYYLRQVSLPHFRTVRPDVLYRSGQPRGVGLAWVKAKGIRTLVNLRKPDSDGTAEEKAFAEENGLEFHNFSIGTSDAEIRESVSRFLALVDDESKWPILVHCSRGKERSGVMSAVFRIEFDGWSNEKALEEAHDLGLDHGRLPVPVDFIRRYRKRGSGTGPTAPPTEKLPEAPWKD